MNLGILMDSQEGGWHLLQPKWRSHERKNKFFYKPAVDAMGLGGEIFRVFSDFIQTIFRFEFQLFFIACSLKLKM